MSDQEDYTEQRQAKTKKGRKILEDRESKLVEDPRQTLFIRGNKSSNNIRILMKEWYQIKKDFGLIFSRKHEISPFDNKDELESYCVKNDCTQFCLVSHSKKRPDNLVIGRLHDKKILDMVELGLKEFKSQEEFVKTLKVPLHSRPLIIFNGDIFGYSGPHMRLQNVLTDFFYENCPVELASSNDINLIISVSANEANISITCYQRQIVQQDNQVLMKFEEIGPRCLFELRRTQLADDDTFKRACKQPKPKKKPNDKNTFHDGMGDKRGKVFVQQQDLSTLALKKRKKLKIEKKVVE